MNADDQWGARLAVPPAGCNCTSWGPSRNSSGRASRNGSRRAWFGQRLEVSVWADPPLRIDRDALSATAHLPLRVAARELGMSEATPMPSPTSVSKSCRTDRHFRLVPWIRDF
jgi:hypothetical protein